MIELPPHCDTLDGPVVTAARKALETGNVNLILPYAPEKAEDEIGKAFDRTLVVRKQGDESRDLADYWFFETVVRLHREGEGAPYTGLKPAGLDWGPAVPRAEKALEKGDAEEVVEFLSHVLEEHIQESFKHAMAKKNYSANDVAAAREYVEAMLGFELYSHHLYTSIKASFTHGKGGEHEH